MERRGPAVVAFLLFIVAVAALSYYDLTIHRKPAETASAQSVETPAPPPDVAIAPDQQVAAVNPTETAPTAEAPAMPGAPVVPSFDVVRVEPTGEAVIAGQAAPEAKVEVLDGAAPIATAEANENGEWAIALDKPLTPGPHDLAVRTTTKDQTVATLSDQRVTVSVPETGSKDVLVVMNAPDAASKILQVPEATALAPATTPGEQVAVVSPPTTDAGTPADQGAATADAGTPGDQSAPSGEAATPDQQVAVASPTAPAESPAVAEPPVTTEPAIAAEPSVAGEPQVATDAPVTGEAPVKTEPPIATEPALTAKVEPPKPEVAVAAVEADTAGSIYIAGTVKTGETVRVYLNDAPLGDAKPTPGGTWLVQTKKDLPAGKYTVRADQVDDAGTVIARSEVPFEREVEVAILTPSGTAGGDTGATLSGAMPEMETVVIKRGDNLWRIARGTWGKGIRWSTIYQANTGQIRNPHWIYPGQVFIMPKGSTTWTD